MGISAGSQRKITNFPASNESAFGDLIPYNIFIAPGETLTASVSGTASTAAGVSLNWIEEI